MLRAARFLPPWPPLLALGLFGLSGVAGLGYQAVWVRVLAAGVGSEVPAMLGVISAVMAGLGIGAWALDGRLSRSRNPGLDYAVLEGVLCVWGIVLALALPGVGRWTAEGIGLDPTPLRHWGLAFGVPLVVLLPSTVAMGATLPALDRWLEHLGHTRRWVGLAYGANVLGAAAGVLGSVWLLMPRLGFRRATLVLAAINGAVAIAVAIWQARRSHRPTPPRTRGGNPAASREAPCSFWTCSPAMNLESVVATIACPPEPRRRRVRSWALKRRSTDLPAVALRAMAGRRWWPRVWRAFGRFRCCPTTCVCGSWKEEPVRPKRPGVWLGAATLCGVLGIGYEILGIRLLSQVLEGTIYTYAAVLAVYLVGTSLGAVLYQWAGRRLEPESGLGTLAGWTTLALAAGVAALQMSPTVVATLNPWLGSSLWGAVARDGLAAILVFLLPTAGMGALFSHLAQSMRNPSGGVGRVAGLNAFGSALAPPLVATVGLPFLGSRTCLGLLALGYLAMTWSFGRQPRSPTQDGLPRRWLLAGSVAAWIALLSTCDLQLQQVPAGTFIRSHHEGIQGFVTVLEEADGNRLLRVDNRFQMGGTAAADAERLQAHLPLLLHGSPRRALFLGTGTGITLGAVTRYAGLEADGVELLPDVVATLPAFSPANRLPELERHARLHTADARRYILTTRQRYDVIVADLFQPARDGAGFLYTREHFTAIRDRLMPGGLFCQWLPLHQLDQPSLQTIARTFLHVFPTGAVWWLRPSAETPVIGLISFSDNPRGPAWEPQAWKDPATQPPALREELAQLGLPNLVRFLGLRLGGPELLRALSDDAPISTDDWPVVVFAAPRRAVNASARPHDRLLELLALTERLDAATPPVEPLSDPELRERVRRCRTARDLYLRGLVADAEDRPEQALQLWLESAQTSADFTTGYAQVLGRATLLAKSQPNEARRLLEALAKAQPGIPVAAQLLERLEP